MLHTASVGHILVLERTLTHGSLVSKQTFSKGEGERPRLFDFITHVFIGISTLIKIPFNPEEGCMIYFLLHSSFTHQIFSSP